MSYQFLLIRFDTLKRFITSSPVTVTANLAHFCDQCQSTLTYLFIDILTKFVHL